MFQMNKRRPIPSTFSDENNYAVPSQKLAVVGLYAAALNDIPLVALQKLELRTLAAPVLVVLETSTK